MPIPTECPACAKRGNTPVTFAGMTAVCQECWTSFRIPSQGFRMPSSMYRFPASPRAPSGAQGFRARVRRLGARLPRAWR